MAPSIDTIKILVATDNHVGYAERDQVRGNDSARTFDEIIRLAKDRDVDMILLAGDLFHENKPSRKAMYEVMQSLRLSCFGDKPCELQLLSDASQVFQGTFNHANYEDENLNVAIPVFSIHGNHDDPSGEGHYAALDLLQVSGLLNYYGRVPEADNIEVKPVLLQKGRTKLALYGLSNVRDERLFRTFRDGKVKFFQPNTRTDEWFNLMSVHQNHHAYTDTGHLPENFLPGFMDLVIWGHEHECLIDPTYNAEMGFHVMQPGSSVATSLSMGEAVPKHVAILSIIGKEFRSESIRLKSVRPFVMKEIVLQDDKEMKKIAKKPDNRSAITRYLEAVVNDMIEEARTAWADLQDELPDEEDWPKPLVRLRVEYTAPEGGKFDCENPQRFSSRFQGKVANVTDVVQFHRKKKSGGTMRASALKPDLPDAEDIAQLTMDSIKVDELVQEYLDRQTLTLLPQNSFGDAVGQFVDKDDNHAVKAFVQESLESQIRNLMKVDKLDEGDLEDAMERYKASLEANFTGLINRNRSKNSRQQARRDVLDSDEEADWTNSRDPGTINGEAIDMDEDDEEEEEEGEAAGRTKAKTATSGRPASRKNAPAKKPALGKRTNGKAKRAQISDEEDNDEDIVMLSDVDSANHNDSDHAEEESQGLFVNSSKAKTSKSTSSQTAAVSKRATTSRASAPKTAIKASAAKQSTINFASRSRQPTRMAAAKQPIQEISDDSISDGDDAFEPAPSATARSTRSRK